MFVKQFVDEGLGNSSYIVGSEAAGVAAVIDPQRDVDRYLQAAEGLGLRLTHVLDTHLHADFVSGARELAAKAGLKIGASRTAEMAFEHLPLAEGDTLHLGEVVLGVVTTPGHTPEHISFTITEPGQAQPAAIFTGGALIVGGAARTDLLGHDLTVPLARQLYHTLHDKLLQLPDAVTVYPTHGAGSFCAAPTSSDRVTSIGRERTQNNLTQARNEDEFVELALFGLPSYPVYYKYLRGVNQRGPRVLGGVPLLQPLPPEAVRDMAAQGVAVLDVRRRQAFFESHIPNAYGIPVSAPLITWAGWLIPFGTPLILVADSPRQREEAVRQLIRIGYDDLRGYLEGGMDAWQAADLPVARVRTITAAELRDWRNAGDSDQPVVLDVRQNAEWLAGHIPGAVHVETGRLPYDELALPTDGPVAIHCQLGNRATSAWSVLTRRGYDNLVVVDTGFDEWQAAGFEVARGA